MKRYITYALLLVAAVGCQKSHVGVELYSDNKISFASDVEPIQSRGAEATTATFASDFKVGLFLNDLMSAPVPYLVPTSGDTTGANQFLTVSKNSSNIWGYATGNTYYWPTDSDKGLNIAAVYPNWLYSTNNEYGFSISHTADATVSNQVDMLFAYEEDVSYNDSNNGVYDVQFHHGLSKVGFTAQIADGYDGSDTSATDKKPKLSVTIYDMTMHNIESQGNFYVKSATESYSDWCWTHYQDSSIGGANPVVNYAVPLVYNAGGIEVSHAEANDPTEISSEWEHMMLIPFKVRPWVPANGLDILDPHVAAGGTNTNFEAMANRDDIGSYLSINCKIEQSVMSTDGVEDTTTIYDGYIYVPFSSVGITYPNTDYNDSWRRGYAITYNLIFGGGYTTNPEDGKTPVTTLTEMSYNVTTEPWVDESVDVDDDDKSISLTFTIQGMTDNPYEVDMEDGTVTKK